MLDLLWRDPAFAIVVVKIKQGLPLLLIHAVKTPLGPQMVLFLPVRPTRLKEMWLFNYKPVQVELYGTITYRLSEPYNNQ